MTDFKLTQKQIEQVNLMASDAKHIMSYGGSRSGKTFGIVRANVIRACKEKSRHVVLRQTFNSIKTSVVLDTLPKVMRLSFPDLKYDYNKTDNYAILANGSEIWFAGLDDDKRVEKILGKEFSTLTFNECSQIPYASVQVALSRLAEKNNLKKKVYYDMNPPNKAHWAYALFEQGLNPVDNEPLKNPNDYRSILMNPIDNIQNIDSEYLALLESMPERERNRFLLGMYADDSDGQVYYAFNPEKHVKEFDVPAHGTLYIASDFNVSPTTSVVFKYINGVFMFFDEIYLEVGDTYKLAAALKAKGYIGTLIPDSTGGNRRTSGISDHEILRQSGQKIPSVFNPAIVDRINNMNRLLDADRMIFHARMKKTRNDLTKVVYRNGVPDQTGANKMLTHLSDCCGYGAWHLDKIGIKMNPIAVSKYM